MTTQVVYSKEFLKHNHSGHPENAERLNVIMNEIKKAAFYEELDFIEVEPFPEELLGEVHSPQLIKEIKDLSLEEKTWIDLDTYVCQSDYETARLAVGAVVQLCKNVINGEADNAFALVRPPGHHATVSRAMGFCIFNNAAVAANEITKKGKKVLIFDHDTHHGNGTQNIFYHRKDVLYQSIHLYPHYPGTGAISEVGIGEGEGYTVNAPLSHGKGDKAVDKVLDEVFLPIARQFKPDLIIFSSGFDSHHADPLGGLKLTTNFYGEMISKYKEIQPKIVCTLEGGYNLNWIGKCLVSQLASLLSKPLSFEDSAIEDSDVRETLHKIKDVMGSYWQI
jgi:acetoin utilization deacetylase AcuC-like enzyme